MSEKEKRRRDKYRKNRDKWIFAQAIIIAVITIAVIISSIVACRLAEDYYVEYTDNGNIDYNVFLKENDFYEEEYIGKNQSYVASLIDHIIANLYYEINMNADEEVHYRYTYKVNATLEIIDDTSGVPIFNPVYELVPQKTESQSSESRMKINQIVILDYDEYNALASRFIETYSLTETTSNLIVSLEVDVLSDCTAFSGGSSDHYVSELRIPLTTKTVNIEMTSAIPDGSSKLIACTRGAGSDVFKTTAIVLLVVDVLLALFLLAFIRLTRTEDITYTARVKRIVSHYKSYIQKINNLFDARGYQVVLVDSFDEMLEIRDTVQAPILMHENADKTCTKFIIPTDSKLLYSYTVKIDGYEEEPLPPRDPECANVCRPNITNVVRPTIKVVVTPPETPKAPEPTPTHEATTVIEEPEIEAEDVTVCACVTDEASEISLAEAPEDAQVFSIEEANEILETEDCEDGVDAIDVFWKERNQEDKTYRYDPDGNSVEAGDVVLVPTRDVASDKEVVREAEVSRGNYKVDPETLEHPLKKIIGVVRRRAERVFTTLISPEDEENK